MNNINELLKRIDEDREIILSYDTDLRKANSKLDAIKEILNHTAWINIGNIPKRAIEKMHKIIESEE